MKNGLRIKKVKNVESDGKIMIEYERIKNGHCDVVTLVSGDAADPSFYDALTSLAASVCGILELDLRDFEERIEPYGVTFKYDKSDVMSAIISANLELPHAETSISLNTPIRKCAPDEETAGLFFTEATARLLWALESEARKYVSGKRAQMSLFGEEPADNNETESDAVIAQTARVIDLPEAIAR